MEELRDVILLQFIQNLLLYRYVNKMSDVLWVTHLIRQLSSHYFSLHQMKVNVLMRGP